jgi:hypothetical protein
MIGMKVVAWEYERSSWHKFAQRLESEPGRHLRGLPVWPAGKPGRLMFELARIAQFPWAKYAHSMMVVLEREL